jgi:outer membrane lipoprotein-sorting protein
MFVSTLVLVLAQVAPSPAAEAEQLLREMDQRITAAKTVRIEFEIQKNGGTDETKHKGVLLLGPGNRMRFETAGWQTTTAVSDGKQLVTVTESPAQRTARAVPGWFGEAFRSWLGRGGTFVSAAKILEYLEKPDAPRPDAEDGPKAANVRRLPDEKIGGVTTRVVEYDLTFGRKPEEAGPVRARVWIDAATKLPVRRSMTFPAGAKLESFTATHTKIEVDQPIGDDRFRLPK